MTILSNDWGDTLDPIVHHYLELGESRPGGMIDTFFNVQSSTRSYEEVAAVGGMGIEAWDAYQLTNNVPTVDFDAGYKKTYTHEEFVVEMVIEAKLMEDSNYRALTDAPFRLGYNAALKREIDAASVFNNAFSSSFVGGDAVALCSDSHPYSENKSNSTQDNKYALALTKASVATVREAMMAVTDDAENLQAVTPRWLVVPPAGEDDALVIANSLLDPESAENAINPQAGRFTVIVHPYMTDSNAWFMIDPSLMKMSLDWFNRVPLNLTYEGMYKQVSASWTARMRYSYGFSDWRWIAGSTTT